MTTYGYRAPNVCAHAANRQGLHLRIVEWFRRIALLCSVTVCLALSAAQGADAAAGVSAASTQAELAAKLLAERQADKAEAVLWAQQHGYPVRYEDDQRVCELMGVWRDRPIYYTTQNVNAATSSAADRIKSLTPWQLDGTGVILGLWDESVPRASHQEFLGADGQRRIRTGDTGWVSPHTTHVAGILAATGVDPAAEGMAPAATIHAFNWEYDAAKMVSHGAYAPGQSHLAYISNHSYGFMAGWDRSPLSGNTGWHWVARWVGAKSYDDWFGAYSPFAWQWDDVAYQKGYYLAFAAAGNDRADNPPLGETVYYWEANIWHSIVYDPATCPLGDGLIKGGYDTICGPGVAKNVMTVGAVDDAVAGGMRSLADANMAVFSSWGPTKDGRIKPDIVANGVSLYSTDSKSDSSYATHSGTSMASPSAAGSAALLVQLYQDLFPGQSMRASTLKGLIINTADDLGQPGPDYRYGWGLMNARAAAELIQKQYEGQGSFLMEGQLTSYMTTDINPDDDYYLWATGDEPIRVTLCWTDPPGAYVTNFNETRRRLVHDLDVRVIGPDGSTTYTPYVLDPADPCAVATTGDNKLDNVEQVYIGTPSEAGQYKVHVSYKGPLTKDRQQYSVLSTAPLYAQHAPVAEDMSVYTTLNSPVTISLKAADDGLPKPPAQLTYTIATLPQHGSLTYPDGRPVTAPDIPLDATNQVVYTPAAGYDGEDSFCFYADDGGTAPSGGPSNMAVVTVCVTGLITQEFGVIAPADDASVDTWTRTQVTTDRYLRVGRHTSGIRFQGINIPPGAQISKACLKLYLGVSVDMTGQIRAEATGNAADFTGDNRSIPDMVETQAMTSWEWRTGQRAQVWYSSPDCSAVLQEIISRPDWKSGNAVLLIFSCAGNLGNDVVFSARDSGADVAPRLEITFAGRAVGTTDPGQKAPTAADSEMYVTADEPCPITLEADDDGLPGPMEFTISSLPSHGSLALLNGAPVTGPTTLAPGANRVTYTPDIDFTGEDSFTFYADDGGSTPTGGQSNIATVTLKVRSMVTREYQVIIPQDDAYGTADSTIVVSDRLSVGRHSSAMRFRNVDLPRDSEIVSARLKLCMDSANVTSPIVGTLYAQAAGDGSHLADPALRIPDLPRTQAAVPWDWQAGQTQPRESWCPSPDLRTIIQEIVNRSDWSSGNSMVLLYAGEADTGQDLQFYACDTSHSKRAPKLEVTYTLQPGADWLAPPANPPEARDSQVEAISNEPLTITLAASDDRLPDPPGKLAFTIVSLPTHGTLETADGTPITAGQTLANFANQVVYRSNTDFRGDDSFTFYADDGGTPPSGGQSDTAQVQISVVVQATAEYSVTAGADDAHVSRATRVQTLGSEALSVGSSTPAMRFQEIQIPRGAKIKQARLRICSYKNGLSEWVYLRVYAEATDDGDDFSNREILGIERTSASVWWGQYDPWAANTWYESPDIRQLIQEVVDRPGWSTGNSMIILVPDVFYGQMERKFWAYEGDSAKAARLTITYTIK